MVLVEPEIPGNTGTIGRLCLGAGARLHLVHPLGFSLEEKYLLRAGLDYWSHVDLYSWDSRQTFFEASLGPGTGYEHASGLVPEQFWMLSSKGTTPYWSAEFRPGDTLVFGAETRGLPESWLHARPDRVLTIPTVEVRSLNLACSVGIVLFEALRQIGGPCKSSPAL